jgi:hypothetical protein
MTKSHSCFPSPQIELVVHTEVKRLIQLADSVEYLPAKEARTVRMKTVAGP